MKYYFHYLLFFLFLISKTSHAAGNNGIPSLNEDVDLEIINYLDGESLALLSLTNNYFHSLFASENYQNIIQESRIEKEICIDKGLPWKWVKGSCLHLDAHYLASAISLHFTIWEAAEVPNTENREEIVLQAQSSKNTIKVLMDRKINSPNYQQMNHLLGTSLDKSISLLNKYKRLRIYKDCLDFHSTLYRANYKIFAADNSTSRLKAALFTYKDFNYSTHMILSQAWRKKLHFAQNSLENALALFPIH